MIKTISQETMGKSERGWLHSTFHFSFAEYFNPKNMNFGTLRVVNDDVFDAGNGFGTHPHKDMEIVSYVVSGELTHRDSMGNMRKLTRGEVQYMSAGTGVTHSEINKTDESARFLQIWILPDKRGYAPNYGDHKYSWSGREGKWLRIVSGSGKSPVAIHQDMEISVVHLKAGEGISYVLGENRQAYLIQIEGESTVNGNLMKEKDGAEITKESNLTFKALKDSHYILFDMKES